MIYLDYSATTKINEEVLEITTKDILAKASQEEIKACQDQIRKILNTDHEIIFTSGSTESNNHALKSVLTNPKTEIITTKLEHSSINETLKYLETKGKKIIYAPLKDGIVDLESLENLITENTALITICAVNTETGMQNPINAIGKLAKDKKVLFHTDMTGSIGKIPIPLENVDLSSTSSHKFYGPKGIGLLIKNKNVKIDKLIKQERTYNLGLIKGLTKALTLALENQDENLKKVKKLNIYLKENLKSIQGITINSNQNSIPHILNISIDSYKPETFLHYLEMDDIYISTLSACAKDNYSKAILAITNDEKKAKTSVRISLSHLTKKQDLDKLIEKIKRREHAR